MSYVDGFVLVVPKKNLTAYKLSKVFYYTLDNFSQPDAERAAAVAFVIAALGPLALGQMRARNVRYRAAPLVLVAAV